MRILVVEDNVRIAESLKSGLEQEGYAADTVTDGLVAEKKIELNQKDYDLIILDIMLPGKDGVTLCNDIRKKGIQIPVLMLTAKDSIEDKVFGLDHGADDYMVKPFSFEELLSRVRALSRRPRESVPLELTSSGIRLNTTEQKVYVDGREVFLTLKEFRLLEFLMLHPDQVLTRQQLLDHLWDFSFNSFSRVVDMHVKNLRSKIEKGNETIIETIRGVGYRFKN